MKKTVQIFRGYIQRLRLFGPVALYARGSLPSLRVTGSSGGSSGNRTWTRACRNSWTPLLAGILYVIGVFWVERFRLGSRSSHHPGERGLFRIGAAGRSTPSDDVYRYPMGWSGATSTI